MSEASGRDTPAFNLDKEIDTGGDKKVVPNAAADTHVLVDDIPHESYFLHPDYAEAMDIEADILIELSELKSKSLEEQQMIIESFRSTTDDRMIKAFFDKESHETKLELALLNKLPDDKLRKLYKGIALAEKNISKNTSADKNAAGLPPGLHNLAKKLTFVAQNRRLNLLNAPRR